MPVTFSLGPESYSTLETPMGRYSIGNPIDGTGALSDLGVGPLCEGRAKERPAMARGMKKTSNILTKKRIKLQKIRSTTEY